MIDIMLYRFHHHDGVIHHDTDRQYETEKRKGIDGEVERDEEDESTDDTHGDRQDGDQRGAPVLKEDEYHQRY